MTAHRFQHKSIRTIALGMLLAFAAAGVFVVPWHVPVSEESMSLSYVYGFNNTVAVLVVGVTLMGLLALAIYNWWSGAREPEVTGAIAETFAYSGGGGSDWKLWSSCAVASVLFSGMIVGWYMCAPFYRCGEMSYFINRMDLLLIGHVPYYGFPFYYGPGMLYVPYYLYKGAHGLLSVEEAYCVVLVGHWVAGLYLLGYCVRRLFPAGRRVAAFWVFALIFLNPTLGYNYTPFRFVLPVAGMLFAYAAAGRAERGAGAHARVALAAFLCGFVTFEFSPEMGVGATVGLAVYFIALLRTPARRFGHGALFVIAGAAAAVAPWSKGYIGVLFLFGGGNNLPVLPGAGVLLLLGAAFYFIPRFALFGFQSREANGAAALSFCVLGGMLLEPALSRCDLGHVFLNGSALFLVAVAVCSHLADGRWYRRGLVTLLVVFAVLGQWMFLFHYGYFYKEVAHDRALMKAHPTPPAPPGNGFRFSKVYPPEDGLDGLAKYGRLATPLECPENVERFLFTHGQFDAPFNPGYNPDTLTVTEMKRRLADIDGLKRIVVPVEQLYPAPEDTAARVAADLRFLRINLLFPLLKLTPRHPFFDAQGLVTARILKEFSKVGSVDGLVIMDRTGMGEPKGVGAQ